MPYALLLDHVAKIDSINAAEEMRAYNVHVIAAGRVKNEKRIVSDIERRMRGQRAPERATAGQLSAFNQMLGVPMEVVSG